MQKLRHQLPEKLLRRAQLARRKAQRRLDRDKDAKVKDEEHEARRAILYKRKFFIDQLLAARKARREDWELGPLAPRRDVGDQALQYGTADGNQLQTFTHPSKLHLDWKMRHLPPGKRMEKLGWKSVGNRKWEKLGNLIYENDRVAVMRGPQAGKTAVVSQALEEEEMLRLKGVNLVRSPIPSLNATTYHQ
jgi:large subunit ribosomal protein L24